MHLMVDDADVVAAHRQHAAHAEVPRRRRGGARRATLGPPSLYLHDPSGILWQSQMNAYEAGCVLVHGIGEQEPMSTVRGFMKAILGPGARTSRAPGAAGPDVAVVRLRRLGCADGVDGVLPVLLACNLGGAKLWDLGQ